MLTPLGRAARKWRIDRDMRLCDMAGDLGVSVAYLSAVETGRKRIDGCSPIVAKFPAPLRAVVYEEAAKFHASEADRYQGLIRKLTAEV